MHKCIPIYFPDLFYHCFNSPSINIRADIAPVFRCNVTNKNINLINSSAKFSFRKIFALNFCVSQFIIP